MNLPIPKTRLGILTALVLALMLLWMYYTYVISGLFNNRYVGNEALYTDNLNVDETDPKCKGIPVEIIARIPKNTSQIIPGYIYLRIRNKVLTPISVSISVTREWGDVIPLPGVYKDNMLPNKASFENLAPEEEAYIRFLLSLKSIGDLTVHLTQDDGTHYACKLICPTQQQDCVYSSIPEALKRSTIEHLLLPPWSNVIIPVFAFTVVYLLEEEEEEKEHKRVNRPWSDDQPAKSEKEEEEYKRAKAFIFLCLGCLKSFLFHKRLKAFIFLLGLGCLESLLFYVVVKTWLEGSRLLALLLLVIFILIFIFSHEIVGKIKEIIKNITAFLCNFFKSRLKHKPETTQRGYKKQKQAKRVEKTAPPPEEIGGEGQKIQAELQRVSTVSGPLHSPPAQTKECPDCHNPNVPEDAMYCPYCGHRFSP